MRIQHEVIIDLRGGVVTIKSIGMTTYILDGLLETKLLPKVERVTFV